MEWICPGCFSINNLNIKGHECGLCDSVINSEIAEYCECDNCKKEFYVSIKKTYTVTVDA
jgi:hypothetical protein